MTFNTMYNACSMGSRILEKNSKNLPVDISSLVLEMRKAWVDTHLQQSNKNDYSRMLSIYATAEGSRWLARQTYYPSVGGPNPTYDVTTPIDEKDKDEFDDIR